jgi:hypothetical protein
MPKARGTNEAEAAPPRGKRIDNDVEEEMETRNWRLAMEMPICGWKAASLGR